MGLVDVEAVQRLLQKAASGTTPGERDEMGLALVASSQLLHHLFVDKFSSATSSTSTGIECR